MSTSIMRRRTTDDAATLRDASLIDDFLEELNCIASRFTWFVDRDRGIRASYQDRVGWICCLGAVWYARTGYKEWLGSNVEGHLELLLAKVDHEMHLGSVSLRLAQAIDKPYSDPELGGKLLRAVGIKAA